MLFIGRGVMYMRSRTIGAVRQVVGTELDQGPCWQSQLVCVGLCCIISRYFGGPSGMSRSRAVASGAVFDLALPAPRCRPLPPLLGDLGVHGELQQMLFVDLLVSKAWSSQPTRRATGCQPSSWTGANVREHSNSDDLHGTPQHPRYPSSLLSFSSRLAVVRPCMDTIPGYPGPPGRRLTKLGMLSALVHLQLRRANVSRLTANQQRPGMEPSGLSS